MSIVTDIEYTYITCGACVAIKGGAAVCNEKYQHLTLWHFSVHYVVNYTFSGISMQSIYKCISV